VVDLKRIEVMTSRLARLVKGAGVTIVPAADLPRLAGVKTAELAEALPELAITLGMLGIIFWTWEENGVLKVGFMRDETIAVPSRFVLFDPAAMKEWVGRVKAKSAALRRTYQDAVVPAQAKAE
jgi:hypothetical protein